MARVELKMPKLGESVVEATIIRWVKNVGDTVKRDETVLEIATDKVDSEVPATDGGRIAQIFFKDNDVVAIGATLAILETDASAALDTAAAAPAATANAAIAAPALSVPYVPMAATDTDAPLAEGDRFYSPLVMSIAKTEGIAMAELDRIAGTGKDGRVTKKDMLTYVDDRKNGKIAQPVVSAPAIQPVVIEQPAAPKAQPAASAGISIAEKTFNHGSNYEIMEMDRMRKMIAENMVYSKHISPHVTSFVEADVTNIVLWRERAKKEFEKKYGEKITFTPIFVQAIAKALREFPRINASVQGTSILLKKDINVGVAVALPSDNLIVPVIRNADRLNLVGITAAVNDLAARARVNKLKPDELEGGTYTLSNVGSFGNVAGTPIIMQPQVAIMAVGAIRKMPAVVETPTGDVIAIRHKMFLSHSYDHRVVDGGLGGKFVRYVADVLEAWDLNAEI